LPRLYGFSGLILIFQNAPARYAVGLTETQNRRFPTLLKIMPTIPWEPRPANCQDVVWRYSQNPVIDRNPVPCAGRVFNSALVPYGDGYIAVLRIDRRDGKPQLHLARSADGIEFEIENEMIEFVNEAGEPVKNGYAYDPRLCLIEGTYYITWCDDFPGASIGLARTKDFKTFVKMESPLMPFNRNGVLFPRKINGDYVLLSRPSDSGHTPFGDILLSHSPDLVHWGRHRHVMSPGGSGWWQTLKMGAGPNPIELPEGWLLFYHAVTGTCNGFVYSMGAALLDLENPAKALYRTRELPAHARGRLRDHRIRSQRLFPLLGPL